MLRLSSGKLVNLEHVVFLIGKTVGFDCELVNGQANFSLSGQEAKELTAFLTQLSSDLGFVPLGSDGFVRSNSVLLATEEWVAIEQASGRVAFKYNFDNDKAAGREFCSALQRWQLKKMPKAKETYTH